MLKDTNAARGPFMANRHLTPLRAAVASLALHPCVLLAADAEVPAHRYEIASTMLMPHLDEMRRQVSHHTRCIKDDRPTELFPVFEQHALRGCTLGYEKVITTATGARHDYVLSCASARVASGTASIESAGQKRVGMLAVKMGGKNMTFSQRIEAQRGARCTPP